MIQAYHIPIYSHKNEMHYGFPIGCVKGLDTISKKIITHCFNELYLPHKPETLCITHPINTLEI